MSGFVAGGLLAVVQRRRDKQTRGHPYDSVRDRERRTDHQEEFWLFWLSERMNDLQHESDYDRKQNESIVVQVKSTMASKDASGRDHGARVLDKEPYQQHLFNDLTANAQYTYTIRGLRNDDEVHDWATFCASIFAYKPNPPPPSYFERHFYNDPEGPINGPSLIRVAVDNETKDIVASCRVFVRTISSGSFDDGCGDAVAAAVQVRAGGIGEVCTSNQHRKRGLSKILLLDCLRIMKEQLNLQVSLLHAAPVFFPVYEKSGGYKCTKSEWSSIQISYNSTVEPLSSSSSSPAFRYHVRLASFPNDTFRLQSLHQQYSERRFAGCIIRSEEYWNTYLSKELDNSLFVLTKTNASDDIIVAWLSIRQRGENRYQLREFGVDTSANDDDISTDLAMEYLLPHAMNELLDNQAKSLEPCTLVLPSVVLDETRRSSSESGASSSRFAVDWSTASSENDLGWMYLPLNKEDVATAWLDSIIVNPNDDSRTDKGASTTRTQNRRHLIWPADSF